MSRENIIVSGAGGQGIMLLGKIIASSAMKENKHVTWLPAYGAEVRGGTAHCMVIISDEPIGSPYILKADTLIIMNEPSLEKFQHRLNPKGLLLFNSSFVKANLAQTNCFGWPFTDIALKLGNAKVANMVALGSYISRARTLKKETILRVIVEMAPAGKQDLIAINKKALEEGMQLK